MTSLSIKEETLAASYEIDLVSRVRLLWVLTRRRVKLNHEGAVRKNWNGEVARGWRALGQGVPQTNMDNS